MARYRVFITPRGSEREVDVSDRIHRMGKISSTIDQADFLIGVSSIDSTRIQLLSKDGLLSESGIFKNGRGGSKVRILLDDDTLFNGFVSDDGTKTTDDKVELIVLSLEGIMKNTVVDSSVFSSGLLASEVIRRLLRARVLRGIIGDAFIQPDIDVPIDNIAPLVGRTLLAALNDILLVCNSFLLVDHQNNVRVSGRLFEENSKATFYGPHALRGREPSILKIHDHNAGTNRVLNRIITGDRDNQVIAEDKQLIERYGLRERSVTSDLVTNRDNAARVAFNLLRNFKLPKPEFKITVPTKDAFGIFVGDVVTVDYPRKIISRPNAVDRYGEGEYGTARYSTEQGIIRIDPRWKHIVYERHDKPTDHTTEFKLRER